MMSNGWNYIKKGNKYQIASGQINYLNRNNLWEAIDCLLKSNSGVFEVDKAPFEFQAPKFADQAAEILFKKRFDIFHKKNINVPDANRFGFTIIPQGVNHVEGILDDINGDGRLDAVRYSGAYDFGDLIYYVHHGRIPTIKQLATITEAPAFGDVGIEHEGVMVRDSEITPRRKPDNMTREEFVSYCKNRLNTPLPLESDKGFAFIEKGNTEGIGFGIEDARAWTSSINLFTGQPKDVPVTMTINKKPGKPTDRTVVIKKTVSGDYLRSLEPADFPIYVDPTIILSPDAGSPGTTTVDGDVANFSSAIWATVRDAVNADAVDDTRTTIRPRTGREGGGNYLIQRGVTGYDLSSVIGTVLSADLKRWPTLVTNIDNDGDDFITVVSTILASNVALAAGDYDINNFGITEFTARVDLTGLGIGAYRTDAFNVDGVAFLEANKGSVINLGHLEGHDFIDSPIVVAPFNFNQMQFSSADDPSQKPILEIITEEPIPPAEPTPLAMRIYQHLSPNGKPFRI